METDVSRGDMVMVEGYGSLNSIIKEHYRRDLANRTEVFDTNEQQQAITQMVINSGELNGHPEMEAALIKYAVADFQGQSAAAGFKELRESVEAGVLIQSKMMLAVESTKTLKIESGTYVPLAYASASDLYKVWERQQDEAEKITHQSGETKAAFRVIWETMNRVQAKTLGELVAAFE
jgi:hypothetical protein